MTRFYYKDIHIQFLRDNYPFMDVDSLTVIFNETFDLNKSVSQIKETIRNYSIKSGFKCGKKRLKKYTVAQFQFLAEKYREKDVKQLTASFNQRFKCNKTPKEIGSFLKNHGIKSGRSGHFEVGHIPHNKDKFGWLAGGKSADYWFKAGVPSANVKPEGDERLDANGYVLVKACGTWLYKQRLIYQSHIGDIQEGNNIRFKDGDKYNFDPDNLIQVSNSVSMCMTHNDYTAMPDELKESVVVLSKLQSKIYQIEKHQ